jgi:hypothetical protein
MQAEHDLEVASDSESRLTSQEMHDVQASLAIINGYSRALADLFEDLSVKYAVVVGDSGSDKELADITTLEFGCNVSLSGLTRSVEQLKCKMSAVAKNGF